MRHRNDVRGFNRNLLGKRAPCFHASVAAEDSDGVANLYIAYAFAKSDDFANTIATQDVRKLGLRGILSQREKRVRRIQSGQNCFQYDLPGRRLRFGNLIHPQLINSAV